MLEASSRAIFNVQLDLQFMRSRGERRIILMLGQEGQQRGWGMVRSIGQNRLSKEFGDRSSLLATGFDRGEDALDEEPPVLGLSAMRSAPPEHRMAQSTLSGIIGGIEARTGREAPQTVLVSQQLVTGSHRTRRGGLGALLEPVMDELLDSGQFRQEVGISESTIADARPQHQQIFALELHIPANGVRITAAFEDFLSIPQQMAP